METEAVYIVGIVIVASIFLLWLDLGTKLDRTSETARLSYGRLFQLLTKVDHLIDALGIEPEEYDG